MFKKSKEFNLVISQIEDWRKIYFGITAALISAVIVAAIPYIYGRLVDIAIAPNSQIKIIFGIISLWLALSLLSNVLNRLSSRYACEISTDVGNNLIVDLFHHILILPLKFHKEKKMSKVMRKAEQGINELSNLIERTVFSFLPAVISLIIALIILLFVEWRLSLILIIASLGYILVTFAYTKKIIKNQKRMHQSWEKAHGDLWDAILNIQAVKSAAAEKFEKKRNIKNFNSAGRIYKNWLFIWQKMSLWQNVILTIGFITVFGIGVMMLRSGILTPGKLIMFIGYTALLTSPLTQLADQYRMVKTAITAFKRAIKYYDIVPEKDLAFAKDLKEVKGKISFRNMSFGYKKDRLTLKNISFEVQPGEVVAIVGKSGVGKTTLCDLIARYYFPLKGQILIDDINIKKIKLKSLRDQMAFVPQEILLFNDTIKNNIRYGKISASEEKIIAAAKAANAEEFINTFSKNYNQLVGERGIKLSAGQKQRIAISRAILRDPKILILDEATSSLDSISEKLVQDALKKLISGRTTFIIAHRLSTIQSADKIIVLEKGKIVEMGNHEELMKNPEGIYRNFWELQTALRRID